MITEHSSSFIENIALKDFDLTGFVRQAVDHPSMRDELVDQMLHNPDIMVYYHCFYVLEQASQERPDLFAPYWQAFAGLLRHPNSYHRDFGLTLLANLSAIVPEERTASILPEYLEHLQDQKFMTALCCLRQAARIIRQKPRLKSIFLARLLSLDQISRFPVKQKALMMYDVLVILEELCGEEVNQDIVAGFVKAQMDSPSPKTRKKAREMAKRCS